MDEKYLIITGIVVLGIVFGLTSSGNINVDDGVIRDENGSALYQSGGLPVSIQDYTGEPFSLFLTSRLSQTTLQQDIQKGDLTINVDDTTNCTALKAINIIDDGYYFQSLINSVTTNTITMKSESDKYFNASNTIVECGEWDLSNSDGSVTPENFEIRPPKDASWHIISSVFNCLDNNEMDSGNFCGIPSLNNGISSSIKDNYTKDLFFIYNNNGFTLRGFNLNYIERAPSGVYGMNAKILLKENYGAVINLKGSKNDTFSAKNRDDLTEISESAITINGHYVTNE